jgi:hypothetical protein
MHEGPCSESGSVLASPFSCIVLFNRMTLCPGTPWHFYLSLSSYFGYLHGLLHFHSASVITYEMDLVLIPLLHRKLNLN